MRKNTCKELGEECVDPRIIDNESLLELAPKLGEKDILSGGLRVSRFLWRGWVKKHQAVIAFCQANPNRYGRSCV